jgi:tetratricopeptide (TPR) repeat protein
MWNITDSGLRFTINWEMMTSAPRISRRPLNLIQARPANLFNRGLTHFKLKLYAKAIADFSQVLRLQPAHADAYFWRANSYRALGEKGKAEDDEKKARQPGSQLIR